MRLGTVLGNVLAALACLAAGVTLHDAIVAPPPIPAVHYAPAEDLEALDIAALGRARRTIDMAAYILTDAPVIAALAAAARRGVAVRLLFDRGELERRPETPELIALQDLPGVAVRVKRSRTLMHLKAYAVDGASPGALLRIGSANFSRSGLREQDNEMVVLEDARAAARFEADFSGMWAQAEDGQ